MPFPGYLPDPGIKLESPALQADSLPSELSGKLDHNIELNAQTHRKNLREARYRKHQQSRKEKEN